jgi:DNA polymerase III subunit delta
MEVRPEALAGRLTGSLAALYLVAGDEPLIVQESCDAILAAARRAGFADRVVFQAEGTFDWNEVLQEAASLSLFATRRVLDVRVGGAGPGREGGAVLRSFAESPAPDTLLLVRMGRLEKAQRQSAWYQAVAKHGVAVPVWGVGADQLPRWLERRLAAAGLRLAPDALGAFAARMEGNLLAAAQAIEKLRLADPPQPVSAEELLATIEDAAQYDTFELIDAVLMGQAARIARMVDGLRQSGVAVFAVLGALTALLRRYLAREYLPPQRLALMEGFERRLGDPARFDEILAACALVDAQGKGQVPGDAWRSLEELLLRLAGVGVLAPRTGMSRLRDVASRP